MTYPAYPEYKDSGVEWLGEVPVHWSVPKLKHLARIRNGRDYKIVEVESGGYPVIGSGGEFARANNFLFDGESVLLGRKGTIDKPLYINGPFWTVDTMFYTELSQRVDGRFLYYYTTCFQFDQYSTNTALPSMAQEDLVNIYLATPELPEQAHIATFLDHETARIDALVEEQQRLIELLKEKRQAVISHAVTKGLDPDVPMKDSGVEWLGEVPAHWGVVRVKHIKASIQHAFVDGPFGSNLKSDHFIDDGDAYVIESGFATKGVLNNESLKQITHEHFSTISRSQVKGGDIVISKIGARYGMCSILPELDKPAVVSGNSLKLTVDLKLCDPIFAVLVLRYLRERGAIEDIVNMTAQPALSLGEMNNLPFPLPSLEEQKEILKDASQRITKFDDMAGECEHLIALSQERRSALISAAVTGKIDVRGWQPPEKLQAANDDAQKGHEVVAV